MFLIKEKIEKKNKIGPTKSHLDTWVGLAAVVQSVPSLDSCQSLCISANVYLLFVCLFVFYLKGSAGKSFQIIYFSESAAFKMWFKLKKNKNKNQ